VASAQIDKKGMIMKRAKLNLIIVGIYHRLIPNRFARWITAFILLGMTAALFSFPYFVNPEVLEQGRSKGRGWSQCETKCDILKCPSESP